MTQRLSTHQSQSITTQTIAAEITPMAIQHRGPL